ncbi:hypothetical protein WME76_24755 [Sorangium sp. So ce119]|uniref:hypothetical protein n=1 Tax=Sorangium sp. So ce119 TaxID=3133279 RepID=UPI003F5E1815
MIRLARLDEAGALTALCRRSKAHWGYNDDFLRLAAPALLVDAEAIGERRVFVSVDRNDRALGVARLDIEAPGVAEPLSQPRAAVLEEHRSAPQGAR